MHITVKKKQAFDTSSGIYRSKDIHNSAMEQISKSSLARVKSFTSMDKKSGLARVKSFNNMDKTSSRKTFSFRKKSESPTGGIPGLDEYNRKSLRKQNSSMALGRKLPKKNSGLRETDIQAALPGDILLCPVRQWSAAQMCRIAELQGMHKTACARIKNQEIDGGRLTTMRTDLGALRNTARGVAVIDGRLSDVEYIKLMVSDTDIFHRIFSHA